MANAAPRILRQVLIPQALGADEFLPATWHEHDRVIVFSHWKSDACLAATPVGVSEVPELASLLVDAIGGALKSDEIADKATPKNKFANPHSPVVVLNWRSFVTKLRSKFGP